MPSLLSDNPLLSFNSLLPDDASNKANELLDKLNQKKVALGKQYVDYDNLVVVDGDTVHKKDTGEEFRLQFDKSGYSIDPYETNHGDKFTAQEDTQKKLARQRQYLVDQLNKDKWFDFTKVKPEEVTNEMIFAKGEEAKQRLDNALKGKKGIELNTWDEDKYNRALTDIRLDGSQDSLLNEINTPELNTGYNYKSNSIQKLKDSLYGKTTVGDTVKDAIASFGSGMSIQGGEILLGGLNLVQQATKKALTLGESEDIKDAINNAPSLTDQFQKIGYDPDRTKQILDPIIHSQGFLDKSKELEKISNASDDEWENAIASIGWASKNPEHITTGLVAESLPMMLMGMGITGKFINGIKANVAARLSGASEEYIAKVTSQVLKNNLGKIIGVGALAEGSQIAGLIANQADLHGRTQDEYALPAFAAGLSTGGINVGLGRLAAAEIGLLTNGALGGFKGNAVSKLVKSISGETLEEGLQTYPEQVLTNIAEGEDNIFKGTGSQTALGAIAGGITGGGMVTPQVAADTLRTALNARSKAKQEEVAKATANPIKDAAEVLNSYNSVDTPSPEMNNDLVKAANDLGIDTKDKPINEIHDEVTKATQYSSVEDYQAIKGMNSDKDLNQHITNVVGSKVSNVIQIDVLEQFQKKDPTSFNKRKEELQPKLDELYQQSKGRDDPNLIEDNIHTSKLTPLATESIQVIDKEANKTISDDPKVLATINPNKILLHVKRITDEQGKTDLSTLENKLEYQNVVNTALAGFNIIVNKVGINVSEEEKQDYKQIHDVLANLEKHILENTDMTNKAEVDNLIKSNFGSQEPGNPNSPTPKQLEEAANSSDEELSKKAKLRQKIGAVYTELGKLLGSTKNKRYEQTKTDILEGGGLKPAIKDHQQMIETLLKSDKIPAKVLNARMDVMHDWLVYHAQKAKLAQNLVNAHTSGNQDQINLARKELSAYYDKEDQFTNTQKRAINDDGYTPAQFKNLSDQVQLESYAIRLVYKSLYEEAKVKFPEEEFPSDLNFKEKELLDTEVVTPETDTTEEVKPEVVKPTKDTSETPTEKVEPAEESKPKETKISDVIQKEFELWNKVKDKFVSLFPGINLHIDDAEINESDEGLNQREFTKSVNYTLKVVDLLQSFKAIQMFAKGNKVKWTLDKVLNEIGGFGNYKQLFNTEDLSKPVNELDREQLAIDIASKFSYTVDINIAGKDYYKDLSAKNRNITDINAIPKRFSTIDSNEIETRYTKNINTGTWSTSKFDVSDPDDVVLVEGTRFISNEDVILAFKEVEDKKLQSSKYASDPNWEYREIRITTPLITPTIKGHADFATENDIGWTRVWFHKKTGELEVQEIQSDLFQKGRNLTELSSNIAANAFLQLLNKNNNWQSFFINSLIQFAAKNKFKTIRFPKGDTAALIEGHEIDSSPVYSFYENTLTNVLSKQGYNPKEVTDTADNRWNEVAIVAEKVIPNIFLQKDLNRITGQANIEAMSVLINSSIAKLDTLPHEYAHHYISWFRETAIVKNAINKYGTEEALVQAIGEQVITQKGIAYNWWKKFSEWLLNKLNLASNLEKEQLKNLLTDALLTAKDLSTDANRESLGEGYNKYLQATRQESTLPKSNEYDDAIIKESTQPEQNTLQDESDISPTSDEEFQSLYDSYQEEVQDEESNVEPLTAKQLQSIFNNIIGLIKANKIATTNPVEMASKILTHLFQTDLSLQDVISKMENYILPGINNKSIKDNLNEDYLFGKKLGREEANNKFLEWQAKMLNTLSPIKESKEAINYSNLNQIKGRDKVTKKENNIIYSLFKPKNLHSNVIGLLKDGTKETIFTKYSNLFRNKNNNTYIISQLKSIEGKVALDTIAKFVDDFHTEYVKANVKYTTTVNKAGLAKKIKTITDPELKQQLIDYLQKNKDNEITREQALKDFKGNKYVTLLIKNYTNVLQKVEANPSLLLHNNTDEVIDRNITAQLALHALSWMINTGTKTLYTEREMTLHMLGKEEATAPSDEAMAALSTMGLVRGYVANQMAGSIVNYMGFKPNDNIPAPMFPKFETALGLSAIDTLERMGYVEYKGIPQASMDAFMSGEDTVGFNYTSESQVLDKATIFVRIKSDLAKNNEPILAKHVRDLFDKVKPGNKEIQDIFNIELVETEYSATPWEKSKLLEMLGERNGILTFGNSRTQYAKDDRKAVLNGARSAFDNRTAANDLANKLGDKFLKEINFEKKLDAEDHIGNIESNKGLLSSTVSMLDSWKELNDLGEVVYFYYKKMYQGRYQGVGTGHPQTNKLVRWTRSLWKGEVKKDYSDPVFKQFMQAVIEGFKKKPSQMTDAEIQASFTEIYEKHIPVLKLINKDTLSEEEKDAIVQAIHAGGEKYHTMAVLAALSEYHFAVGDTFTTTLMREIDGITNGPLISLIMMSGVNRNTDPNLLKAGGVNTDGSTYLDFIQSSELNDVYKIIANQIDWFKSSLSHEIESIISFGRNPRLESNIPLQQRIAIMEAYPNRIEPQIWVNAIHNLVGVIDRGFAKNPTTVFIFGGSTIKIAANVASKVLFDINNKLLAISKIEDEIVQLDTVKELHADLFNSIGLPIDLLTEYVKAPNKKTFLLNWQLTKSQKTILRNSVIAIYTPVIDNAVKTVFARLLENRKLVNNVYQLTNKIFKHEFERKVDDLVKQGITITAEDIDNILLELQPLMPDIAIYNAEDTPEQRLQLWKEEASKQGKPEYKVQINSPKESKQMTVMGLDEQGNVFESYIINEGTKNEIEIHVPQSASAYAKDMIIAAMSVRAPITSTHNADSHVIQQLLKLNQQVLGIHDAAMMGLDKVEDVSKGMNEALFNLLSNYNYFNEVYKHLERVKSYGKNIDSWFTGTIDIAQAKKEGLFSNEVSTEASPVEISREIVGSWNTRWSKNPETGRNEQIIIFTSFDRYLNFFKDKAETLYKELQENVITPIKQGGSFGNYSGQYPFVPGYTPTGSTEEQIVSIIESGLNQGNTNTKPEKSNTKDVFTWAQYSPNNYEVSSIGDKRFSALYAKLKDGRTIEEAYQLDIKGFRIQGNDWKLGKDKPPLRKISKEQSWNEYKELWRIYLNENPALKEDLLVKAKGKVLTDKFAITDVSQARALAELLNEEVIKPEVKPSEDNNLGSQESTNPIEQGFYTDSKGKLVKFFHGTKAEDIQQFYPSPQTNGLIFFTTNPNEASKYALEGGGYSDMVSAELIADFNIFNEDSNNAFDLKTGKVINKENFKNIIDSFIWNNNNISNALEQAKSLQDKINIVEDGFKQLSSKANVLPVYLKLGKIYPKKLYWKDAEKIGAEEFIKQGYDSIILTDGTYAVFNSNQIRSVHAKFDPNKAESSNILHSSESTTTKLFEPVNSLGNINSTNILDTANRLENVGNVKDEDAHTTHLKSILGGFISKVLQPLQYFEMTSPEANIGEYDPTHKRIGLNISNAPIAPTVKVPMSALTTFVHELVHSVTASALFDPKNSILRSRVQKIFNHIERNLSNEDKEKYSHIFANKNKTPLANGTVVNHGLAELIAFAETEPMFRDLLNSLPKMTVGKITETWDESKDKFVEANLLEIISNVFNKIMVWWNDKIKGGHSTDVLTQLHTLTVQLATAHLKAKSSILDFKVVTDKSDQMIMNKVHSLLINPLLKLLGNNYFTLNPSKKISSTANFVRNTLYSEDGIDATTKQKVDAVFETIDEVKRGLNISEEHWLTYSLNEITGQIAVGNFTQALNMTKKLRDKVVVTIQNTISSNLRAGFKTNLTKQLERVVYNTLLKTDLSSLQDYYKDDLLNMFDGSKRKVEQEKLKKEILKNKNGKLYLGHAYNTAYFMVKNQATKSFQHSTLMNATQIYNMYGSNFKPVGDEDSTVELIDKLIGLYALDIVNQEELNTLKELFNTDSHGLNVTMEVHRQQKEHHLNDILKSNKSLVVKGSTKELTNPNRQIIIATAAEEEKLKLHHYTKGKLISTPDIDLYVYHSKFRFMQPWVQGIISYTHMNNILSDMKGVMKQSDGLDQIIQNNKLDKKAKAKMLQENIDNAKGVFDTTEADYTLNPVFTSEGYVAKHSFMLSNQDKENLLDMNTNFTHVLGAMVANITDKLNTQRLNDESAKMLIKDRMDNLETKGIQWVTLSKDAKTKNERDIWNKLPKEFKETILKLSGSDEVTVNAKLLKVIFGQRKLSLSDFFRPADEQELSTFVKYFGSQLYPYIKKVNLDRTTQVWQEGIGYVKDQLVVKSGTVLIGNEISNFWIGFMEGMTAKQYIKAKTEALKLVIEYHKLQTQINDIEYLLKYDKEMNSTIRTNLETKLSNLTSERNLSLVKKYEDAGQMKTIVEDGLEDENIWSFRNEFFESRIKSVTDKLPKAVKTMGREVFMTHDTKMYQLMKDLTQMSDLTSRIAVGEFKQSHGMTEKEALQLVDEAFINYDIPSHQNVQFAADMGLFMFNKFFFRIQSVIVREVGQHPARFLTLLGMEQVFGAQEAIHHSLMTPDTLVGHVSNPLKLPFALWDSNFYKWLFSFHAPVFQPA